jgi:hypothetical protein
MKTTVVHMGLPGAQIIILLAAASFHAQASVIVPGTSDPWLAGMPPGATASFNDVAPAQSPVLVLGMPIVPGEVITWTAVGLVGHPGDPAGPDGTSAIVYGHAGGPENGISDLVAPINSLIGVFLNDSRPDSSPAPSRLDFSTAATRNYLALSPVLRQTFFMGDGWTSDNAVQSIIVPLGATRFFLGTMDGFEWNNNVGQFAVDLDPNSHVPDTSWNVALLAMAVASLCGVKSFAARELVEPYARFREARRRAL